MRPIGRISKTRVWITVLLMALLGAASAGSQTERSREFLSIQHSRGGLRVEVVYGTGFAFGRLSVRGSSRTEIKVSASPSELRAWADSTEMLASDRISLAPSERVATEGPYLGIRGASAFNLHREDLREGRAAHETYLTLGAYGPEGVGATVLTRKEFNSFLHAVRQAAAFADSVASR